MVGMDKLSYVGFWFGGLKSEDDMRRVARLLADIGYKGVDFKDDCFDTSSHPLHEMLRIAVSATAKEGLRIPCAIRLRDHCSPGNWQKNAAETCEFIRMSADAGIRLVNTSIGPPPPRAEKGWYAPAARDDQKGWDALRGSLEMIAKTAEDCDAYVALETVMSQLANDYFTAREMFRMVDSDHLCLTMDPSHYQLHDMDIPWSIRRWGAEKIKHVHLKDAVGSIVRSGADFPFITPLLGEGHVDWPGFFAALDDIGYDGWYSVEFESWALASLFSAEEAARLSFQCAEALIRSILKGHE